MNKSNDVAYCGLYCGDCIIKNSRISKLSKDILSIIKRKEFEKLAIGLPVINDKMKNLTDLNVGISVLESMCELDCDKNCKSGGGGASCEIRKCNVRLELDGCWECEKFEKCSILNSLEPIHKGANIRNIRVVHEKGLESFLNGEKFW